MVKGDDIQERLIDFAVRIVRVHNALPPNATGRHVGDQLLRFGTAPAAHYAEARGAESIKDFVHKLRICLKELNETHVWLAIIQRSDLLPPHQLTAIQDECTPMSRIINASIGTINRNRQESYK